MTHKLGIIGYGTMGSWHAENVRDRIQGLDVALVYDINLEKREKAKANGFSVCESADELLQSDVDLVLIATPNNFHKDYCVRALDSGKNVVCEKPVCMDMQELDEIERAVERSGKFFTVHFNRRWDVDFNIIKNVLAENLVGKPYQVYSRLFSNRNIPGDWRTVKKSGGGFLYDWGIHLIDQALQLFGVPESVYADLKHIYQPEVDDAIRLNLKYPGNLNVHIIADSWTFINEARWHVSGDDGTATIYDWFGRTGKIVRANVKSVDWTQGCVYTENGLSRSMWPRPQKEVTEMEIPVYKNLPYWELFYENVLDCIEGKATQYVTKEDIRNSLAVVMACFESAEKQSVVEVKKYL